LKLVADGQKFNQQLKDRVSMQGFCFLAIESVRVELGVCWYYTTYNKQHHQKQHKHQQPTPTPTSIHVNMCSDLLLVLVSFQCSCSRSYTDQNSALAENAFGWQKRRLLFSFLHIVFVCCYCCCGSGLVWLVNPPTTTQAPTPSTNINTHMHACKHVQAFILSVAVVIGGVVRLVYCCWWWCC
jgi:hypothetical protein